MFEAVEGQLEVVSLVLGIQLIEVVDLRVELVDEGAEGQSVSEAAAEVFDRHTLRKDSEHQAQLSIPLGQHRDFCLSQVKSLRSTVNSAFPSTN